MSEMILASTRVTPQVLLQHGYQFRHTQLDEALRAILA
jgi:NAD dependent epimerase/dehydratase family enzyme